MKNIIIKTCLLIAFLISCNEEKPVEEKKSENKIGYQNGTYCADVTYYNPNNGTEHTYTLNVDVESNKLIRILWNNGGWSDNSHFAPQILDNEGKCSFFSDKGYRYEIKIKGSRCGTTDIIPEEEEEVVEPVFTLLKCAELMQFTEYEIQSCENKFNMNRNDQITESSCNTFKNYIVTMRELNKMKQEEDNGKIINSLMLGSEGNIHFQQIIVKRKNKYYLLDVQGENTVPMGLIDINPYSTDWQMVMVKKSFNTSAYSYYMLLLNESSDLEILEEERKNNLVIRSRNKIQPENN